MRDDPPVGTHGYGPTAIGLCLRLVLEAGVSLRGVPRVLATVSQCLGLSLPVPCWTSTRGWLLRLGHAALSAPKPQTQDWAWLIDHSVQIGQEKTLVILGIRLADLPPRGQALRHQDVHLIHLQPAKSWTRQQVDEALEKAAAITGVPRVIVNDHGGDVSGGVALFQQRHRQTVEIYDIKHKAACRLKKRLETDARWQQFQALVGQTRCAIQQTELAFLVPPAPKPKARFMNLSGQLSWAARTLATVREPRGVQPFATARRLKEKLGWIEDFAPEIADWSQQQQVVNVAVQLINQEGIYRGVSHVMSEQLSHLDALGPRAAELAGELTHFVREQERPLGAEERVPGSTEVLESCFGKFKQLEKQQSRGGFTHLLLGFGAMLSRTTRSFVQEAMQRSGVADVKRWVSQTLGTTLFAQRKLAYASATESG